MHGRIRATPAEYVFFHEMAADKEGNTFAAVINRGLEMGIKIEYNEIKQEAEALQNERRS